MKNITRSSRNGGCLTHTIYTIILFALLVIPNITLIILILIHYVIIMISISKAT